MGASFTARYHSQCRQCYKRIKPGDQAGFGDRDQVLCEHCWSMFGDEFDYNGDWDPEVPWYERNGF